MKNALIVCTVGCFLGFELNDISILQDMGYIVHVATNFNGYDEMYTRIKEMNVVIHQVDFARSPFKITNAVAYRQLKAVMRENKYDLVHCHTPVGGVMARLVARPYRKKGMKVLYTAHGFHFYKGAPIKNWLLFFPIEKICSYMTDILITINEEDYQFAKKNMKAKLVEYVPGVGIDVGQFENIEMDINQIRKVLGVGEKDIVLFSVGELNTNKNHETVIKAISYIENKNIHYFIAGKGHLETYLYKLAEDLNVNLHLLGYRADIAQLLKVADIFVFPSIREGLSVSLMEAMASGIPCVVSKIRGNVDLVKHGKGGFLCDAKSVEQFAGSINNLIYDNQLMKSMSEYNANIIKEYDYRIIMKVIKKIYAI